MTDTTLVKEADIKGIVFDLDGTLYRMRWFFRPLLTCKVFPHCLRLPRFLKIRSTFAGVDMNSGENLMQALYENFSSNENCSTKEIQSWISDNFYPAFVSSMRYFRNSRPAINETLSVLKKKGYRLAVLSDYSKVNERLQLLNIEPSVFEILTSSETSGALKPAARPFLEVASDWNISPRNMLVIGDRDDTDGKAASDAQMHFLKITDCSNQSATALQWNQMNSFLQTLATHQTTTISTK